MKTLTYFLLALGFTIGSCTATKNMAQKPPVKLGQGFYQIQNSSTTNLQIPLLGALPNTISLQKAYFRGKVATITMANGANGSMATAAFNTGPMAKPDIVMHSDPKQEVGNKPPKPAEKSPFTLKEDECVLSYLQNGTTKYFKVSGLLEKKP